uniref:Ig-like domain-containing protein n=1 Tax=Fundulus heteroclitus TaxID=8078 RepID=A0A3Q2PK86_FUNHE
CLWLLPPLLGSANQMEQREQVLSQGRSTSLSCEYTGSIYNIQWYRQQLRSTPEFLLYITEEGLIHPTRSDFSAQIQKTVKRVNLTISSAAVTDSAVYYCALQPTVTGNSRTLYKNLQYSSTSTRETQKSSSMSVSSMFLFVPPPNLLVPRCEFGSLWPSKEEQWSRKTLVISAAG